MVILHTTNENILSTETATKYTNSIDDGVGVGRCSQSDSIIGIVESNTVSFNESQA